MSYSNDPESQVKSEPGVLSGLRLAREKDLRIDQVTDLFSDWMNPILVKETRQALKSRQFFWTFFLLLAAVGIWTLIGMTVNDPSEQMGNAGIALLVGYWIILGFPLLVVIPFGAFRSLAREYEDGTIQLISVTTMKAWQIVGGKLGSSMLQLLVYLSVMAPCIAFTYLLRGLGLPQILLGITFCTAGCFGLSCVALFFAAATRSRVYGVGASILLILIQFGAYIAWISSAAALVDDELAVLSRSDGFFISYGILALIVSTGLLAFAAATVSISFHADNRSTIVRGMMLLQQTLFVGWCITMMCYFMFPEQATVLSFIVAHYWLFMGFLLIGEDPQLSDRVRRGLPGTWLSRGMFSLFFPGGGRGLIFAIANLWACGALFMFLAFYGPGILPEADGSYVIGGTRRTIGNWNWHKHIAGPVSVCTYASFFLSLVFLFCHSLRVRGSKVVRPMFSLAMGILVMVGMPGFALLVHFNLLSSSLYNSYTPEQLLNWYWTSIELVDRGFVNLPPVLVLMAGGFMAGIIFIAVLVASRELTQTQLSTPERVVEEIEADKKVRGPEPGESIDEIFAADRDDD